MKITRRQAFTNIDKNFMERWRSSLGLLSLLFVSSFVSANELQSLDYSALSGNKGVVTLTFSEAVEKPESFATDEPARIVLDFHGVSNKLNETTQQINNGQTRSIATVEAGERTRMVINLLRKLPYEIEVEGKIVKVFLNENNGQIAKAPLPNTTPLAAPDINSVTDIDFRRGEQGEGRLILQLKNENTAMDIRRESGDLIVDLPGVDLPDQLKRKLDVMDFATPVNLIESMQTRDGSRLVLTTTGKFEHLAYQSGDKLVVEVKPVAERTTAETTENEFGFEGEKLSLNFQNIEVRAVLQLLADFNGMNLVTSDTVTGNLTLRLKNVPWDQALDIILKTKGLGMRQNGNVMLIAPAAEIAAREKQELEARRQLVELEPLYSEIFEVNFAKATDMAEILTTTQGQTTAGSSAGGFLSDRGSVVVDQRTNSLLLRDTARNLADVRKLIEKLDIPVRQVLIESRIVIANNDFTKELGVRFGTSAESGTLGAGTSGSLEGLQVPANNLDAVVPTNQAGLRGQDLNVNLPVANPAGTIALALAKLPLGAVLELELSAMQEEGKGEIISTPRVITSNQKQATIEQGTEIPYQEASSSGATSVSFKEALLKLDVTPQITPDDRIVMDLEVNKDEVGAIFLGVPSIDTRSVRTQVLVDNGETVVLGGIYEQTSRTESTRVPFFGDLPYVGFLFKTNTNEDRQRELLVFVTPKIIKEGMDY
ncbi:MULTISPECIES: type IV pilus secretin PilQ [unclassified Methylophaga]|jgi:type IV pilus assembly protein PilQ|uniref:type IV pilus secretin PilQ n=4 Tax=Methylophaga TaxID=40222 RepID=UPI000C8D41E2|nr:MULTISPECIES: type IV pilus secretin PilQ [unclassified Methylophaga]MAL50118.1 pilus assembly protein PilQ [Methylophaga sp.]HCC82682.1 type IV pilus secretin PilQ [Methylophaga sp.]|tara:strand:+ start:6005 stop:8140 length:2136 start_codon:yes stop_codon:yes gene_type:complete